MLETFKRFLQRMKLITMKMILMLKKLSFMMFRELQTHGTANYGVVIRMMQKKFLSTMSNFDAIL